uniref:Ig-like domain-containing protein n=1 Tax=Sparus aurata TaxID=8175 RepID=A0A671TK40_SPAAU
MPESPQLAPLAKKYEGQITVTQPGASVAPGQTVSIRCKVSPSTNNCFQWYIQKNGEAPTLLIRCGSTRHSGVSDRFSGSGSGTDYTLTISGVQAEDAAVYHCKSYHWINGLPVFTQ